MGTSTIPVDPFNPGQVFACVGFAEVAHQELGNGTRSNFVRDETGAYHFELIAPHESPLAFVDAWLRDASLRVVCPEHADFRNVPRIPIRHLLPGEPFPVRVAKSDIAPLEIVPREGRVLSIHHWAEDGGAFKWFAGMAGYPGAALFRDARDRLPPALPRDPFAYSAPARSTAGFDARCFRVALDVGTFRTGTIQTYPYVDVWAALGLVMARPAMVNRNEHRYGLPIQQPLPIALLRAAIGCAPLALSCRTFRYRLVRPPGMYSRFIQSVVEES